MFVAWSAMRSRFFAIEDEVDFLRSELRMARDLLDRGANHGVLVRVDLVVVVEHERGAGGIVRRERVERAMQDALRFVGERSQPRGRRNRLARRQALGGLSDVAREVADALEVRRRHLGGDHVAQIVGDRRLRREDAEHGVVDRDVEAVDVEIVDLHFPRQRDVAPPQALQRLGEDRLAQTRHP